MGHRGLPKNYFTNNYCGGVGTNSDGDEYAKLGGGIKRWRVTKNIGGYWTNTWMNGDEASWISDTDYEAIAARPGQFGCFGLHEWAMVYRTPEHRHEVPLRLGQAGTDAVVEQGELRCTHIDAFRFFTPEAVPRNRLAPTRESQPHLEQPGCLHAGMDVYKWAMKLGPLVPGETERNTHPDRRPPSRSAWTDP